MNQQDKPIFENTAQDAQLEYEVIISGKSAYRHETKEKEKIREKYRASSAKPVVITPAKTPEERMHGGRRKLRVAAYCRVSTPNEAQISSIELQKKYFHKYVAEHEDWVLVGIFADADTPYGQKPKSL